jgi:sulfite reductase (NADPH) flavoprotein alpha-component
VPDVTRVLQDAIEEEAKREARVRVDSRKEIEAMKDDGRYVLEVY